MEVVPPLDSLRVLFVVHPDNTLLQIRVATEYERLHLPLYFPEKSLIRNQAGLCLGKRVSQERFRIHGDTRHRICETNAISYGVGFPSPQHDTTTCKVHKGTKVRVGV